MKIVILPNGFIEFSIRLANSFEKGISATLTIPRRFKLEYDPIISSQVEVRWYEDEERRSFQRIRYIQAVSSILDKVGPDIVHIQQGDIWLCPLLPKIAKSKVVTTVHDVFRHPGDRSWHGEISDAFIAKFTDGFITHGRKLRDDLIERRGVLPEKTWVIPLGTITRPKEQYNDSAAEVPQRVLFFGRMKKYKGLDVLIDAIPYVVEEVPKAQFVIAGRGADLDAHVEKLKSIPCVTVHNQFLSNRHMGQLLSEASIVALPYREASQSGIVSMVFPFGKPVVATDVGALSEVVEDGVSGLLVPPEDPKSFARAIVRLLSDEVLRRRLGAGALQKAQTVLSWDRIAGLTLDVYKKVISRS
jgi:glycosyltransferase involved in cell wall biosynthesis